MRYIILLALVACATGCRLSKNFHEIEKGKAYRSAQLTGEEFAEVFERFQIKTVINLRGYQPGDDWYDEEEAVTQQYGVNLINIRMGASRLPNREDLLELLEAFENAPKPILIHCKAGADRTGEAAALYQMIHMGKTKEEALKMLTLKYLHIEDKYPAKRYFIKHVWQNVDWAYESYFPCKGQYRYYDVNSPVCTGAPPDKDIPGDDDDT